MGEVFLQAPPPLISCWPEYTGTEYKVDSCNKKLKKKEKTTEGKGLFSILTIERNPFIGCNFKCFIIQL